MTDSFHSANAETKSVQTHTPGPMKHAALMGSITVGFRDEAIFHCGLGLRHGNFSNEQVENARRLVASWNACEGVDTETLEGNPAPFSRLREERDALLKMLHRLEVSANTVAYCYDKRPENFAAALTELQDDAEAARALVTKATGATS